MEKIDLKAIKNAAEKVRFVDRKILLKVLEGQELSEQELKRGLFWTFPIFSLFLLNQRFQRNQQRAEEVWKQSRPTKIDDIGTVQQLTVLPLIDYYGVGNFSTESGVSYYLRLDETNILFDTGANDRQEHPSPLLQNMMVLGLHVGDLNYVFISHLHGDHVGGTKWARNNTFAISGVQLDLSHIEAFCPVPMSHPSAKVTHLKGPTVICEGVASIGPINRALFFAGMEMEQSLVVNVKDKGLVVIVGCGHQGLHRIIERVEQLFDLPLYGIIGGLHYPLSASRMVMGGVPLQRLVGTGKPVWDPLTKEDLEDALTLLKARRPKLVALSPHDSCDESIKAFESTFGKAYTHIKVGEPITIA